MRVMCTWPSDDITMVLGDHVEPLTLDEAKNLQGQLAASIRACENIKMGYEKHCKVRWEAELKSRETT